MRRTWPRSRVHVVRGRLLIARGDLDGAAAQLEPALAIAVRADDVQHGALAHIAQAELPDGTRRSSRKRSLPRRARCELADDADDDFYDEPATRLGVEMAADLAEDARPATTKPSVAAAIDARRAVPRPSRVPGRARAASRHRTPDRGELATIAAEQPPARGGPRRRGVARRRADAGTRSASRIPRPRRGPGSPRRCSRRTRGRGSR